MILNDSVSKNSYGNIFHNSYPGKRWWPFYFYLISWLQSAILPITSVSVNDMGVYRCVADNNIKPPAEHLAQVLVFHAPSTRVVQDSVGQAQNRRFNAKLECIVKGVSYLSMKCLKLTFKKWSLVETWHSWLWDVARQSAAFHFCVFQIFSNEKQF